jgi:CDP-paratose 2-epimerase
MSSRRILITGGAGFIGANLAAALLADGYRVTIYDNLSRPGSSHNLAWLQRSYGDKVVLRRGDIRDATLTAEALADADTIIHLAGQVAVTTSVANPREDFDINALGTFNVLEAARAGGRNPIVLYSSTNKVYGGMEDIVVVEDATRWRYRDLPRGVTEAQPLDFHSPYGCSKGTGDQYVRDYHRIYDLRTVVFRQSAIYGPRQFGVEDQGWAAHFIIATQFKRPMSIYGDGKQERSFSFVSDVVDPMILAGTLPEANGEIFNVGPDSSTMTILELAETLAEMTGYKGEFRHVPMRPKEVRVVHPSSEKARRILGYEAKKDLREGLQEMVDWIKARGTKPFNYHLPVELSDSPLFPVTWKERLF